MDTLLYLFVRSVVGLLQMLPLPLVARLGRFGGEIAYWCDARHRRVALQNLILCFGAEKSPAELRALARENFRRIGENYASAIKAAFMTADELKPFCDFEGVKKMSPRQSEERPQSRIVAVGHFGNFELYTRLGQFLPALQAATTYRGLPQPSLNRLMQRLRTRSGCQFFERRSEAGALRAALNRRSLLLGLLADQHAGRSGLPIPLLGHICSTSTAPALFALRYNCQLYSAICFRTGLGRWRIEVGGEIPTRENGRPRSVEEISLDVNRAFDVAIRRDPANWFWVHNRWKPVRTRPRIERIEA